MEKSALKIIGLSSILFGFSFTVGTILLWKYYPTQKVGIYVGLPLLIFGIILIILKEFKKVGNGQTQVSSTLTVFLKILVPLFLFLISILLVSFTIFSFEKSPLDAYMFLVFFILIILFGNVYVMILYLKLKKVYVSNEKLIIKNGNKEIELDYYNVIDLKVVIPNIYRLKLKEETPFGTKIYFAPSIRGSIQYLGFVSKEIDILKRKIESAAEN